MEIQIQCGGSLPIWENLLGFHSSSFQTPGLLKLCKLGNFLLSSTRLQFTLHIKVWKNLAQDFVIDVWYLSLAGEEMFLGFGVFRLVGGCLFQMLKIGLVYHMNLVNKNIFLGDGEEVLCHRSSGCNSYMLYCITIDDHSKLMCRIF